MAKRRHSEASPHEDKASPHHGPGDEPALDGEEWIEWGGELIWAAGFTPGGAPIGLTEREFRRLEAQREASAGWARARALFAWAFGACSSPATGVQVGRVTKVGDGLSREAYAARVALEPDPNHLSGAWVVLLPGRQSTREGCDRWARETWILGQLADLELPFRVPSALGAFPEGGRPAVIRQFIEGVPADLRVGRMSRVRPAELIGQLAAAIHCVDVSAWPHRLPGCAMRRGHGEEMLSSFDDLGGTEAERAREWAAHHLPPDRPAVLVHGDLLGQNILLCHDEKPALIDWEYCRMGDPAYDLAIVTRGVRRPFQMDGGFERLLDAYAEASGEPIARSEVHFHELCLSASWYRAALDGLGSEPPDQALARIHRVLRRAEDTETQVVPR